MRDKHNSNLERTHETPLSKISKLSELKEMFNIFLWFLVPILFVIGFVLLRYYEESKIPGMLLLLISFVFLISYITYKGADINLEYEKSVIFRLGRIVEVKGPGMIWIVPFLDKQVKFDTRMRTVDIEEQDAVTKDGVAIKVNAVLYYHVEKPAKTAAKVMDYHDATIQTALTTLRELIGQHELDQILSDRGELNLKMFDKVDDITKSWGIRIDRIETKDVEIPQEIIRAMARSAQAKREKDARITEVDAEIEVIEKLAGVAGKTASNPNLLELRRLFMLHAVGMEGNNSSTFIVIPSDMFPSR